MSPTKLVHVIAARLCALGSTAATAVNAKGTRVSLGLDMSGAYLIAGGDGKPDRIKRCLDAVEVYLARCAAIGAVSRVNNPSTSPERN